MLQTVISPSSGSKASLRLCPMGSSGRTSTPSRTGRRGSASATSSRRARSTLRRRSLLGGSSVASSAVD
eukprot:11967320-Heterocapsa_arctica.AAC.1